jgi:hypothetical protein
VDEQGRTFEYAVVRHPGSTGLVVHCSAFFGRWGNARAYREQFQGYFHRLKMLGSYPRHDWLFLCDPYGARENGTYYTGQKGDLFVERAMTQIVDRMLEEGPFGPQETVTVGSSMGATGALVLALKFGMRGAVAITPHVDLDMAARHCGRFDEVAWACADGDPFSVESEQVTHRVRTLLGGYGPAHPPPRLFVQACADDHGVYEEQVLPLVDTWTALGGTVDLDVRPTGGHTSDFATRPLLLDAIDRILEGDPIDVAAYQSSPIFAGRVTPTPVSHRIMRTVVRARRLVLGR